MHALHLAAWSRHWLYVSYSFAGIWRLSFLSRELDRRDVELPVTQNRPTDAPVDARRRAHGRDRRTVTSIPKIPAVSHARRRTQRLQVGP